jgi:predicted phage terminase large subunit-like protein
VATPELTEVEELELAALLCLEDSVEPLDDYIARVSPELPPPGHMAPLRGLIEKSRREEVRALISYPPGMAKSTTINHGLAWLIENDPGNLNATTSYGGELAGDNSTAARELVKASDRSSLNHRINRIDQWRTLAGGGLCATGVGGAITGKRVTGLLVCDDLIKGREAAESKTQRDKTWNWFKSDAYSRMTKGASCIVVSTRWHLDDVHGRIMKGETADMWEVINVPAISDDAWIIGEDGERRMAGDPLWPQEYPMSKLVEIRLTVGEYDWASLYMGRPIAKGARVFYEPHLFELGRFAYDGHRACNVIDPATTESTKADYSAIGTFAMQGFGVQSVMWVLHMQRMQVETPKLCRFALEYQRSSTWGRNLLLCVEAVAGFKAVPQILKDMEPGLNIHPITPRGDKFTRTQPVAAAWNDGRVLVPEEAPWDRRAFLGEVNDFTGTGDAHDDMIDVLAHAWNVLYREGPSVIGSRRSSGPFG